MRILIVEDDLKIADPIQKILRKSGYAVDMVHNGIDAEFMGDETPYDLVLLDLGLPKRSGLEVLANWRDKGNKLPVLILTARDAWHERVDGLKAGADDYLGKPFHMEELLARIDALVRRAHGEASPVLKSAGITLDEEKQIATNATGQTHQLTATEFRLLRYFMTHPNIILSKSRLTEHVYEGDTDPDSNVIEVYVKRLRAKLGKSHVETRRGQGYLFVGET
ncbi:MAG: two-component system, OmpR family, response regulator [Thiomicrorhabdus sp.]|nr:MAG: two-component system, OmpR family, response regulator [Thiomicrorhabdus sp.]